MLLISLKPSLKPSSFVNGMRTAKSKSENVVSISPNCFRFVKYLSGEKSLIGFPPISK